MSTLSDQIRELQKRLEQINEEPVAAFNQNATAAAPAANPNAAPAQSAMNVASNNVPQPSSTPASASDGIPTIEAPTFSQAYAQAKKQGLKQFKWCGIYAVKDPVRPQPAKKQTGYWGQGNSQGNVTIPGSILGPQHKGGDDQAPAGTFG